MCAAPVGSRTITVTVEKPHPLGQAFPLQEMHFTAAPPLKREQQDFILSLLSSDRDLSQRTEDLRKKMRDTLSFSRGVVAEVTKSSAALIDPEGEAKFHKLVETKVDGVRLIQGDTEQGLRDEIDSIKTRFQQECALREEEIKTKAEAVKEIACSLMKEVEDTEKEHRRILAAEKTKLDSDIHESNKTIERLQSTLTETAEATQKAVDLYKETYKKKLYTLTNQLQDCEASIDRFKGWLKSESVEIREQEEELKGLHIAYSAAEAELLRLQGVLASKGGGGCVLL